MQKQYMGKLRDLPKAPQEAEYLIYACDEVASCLLQCTKTSVANLICSFYALTSEWVT